MNTSQAESYDLAVIGGGIAGAGIARDAALRGLRVALFEKNTFGSGTSSKSSKLIHGGLRYLEAALQELKRGSLPGAWKHFRFVFTSLKESKTLARIAPDLVQPLPLLIPALKGSRPLWLLGAGSWLYFLLSLLSGGARPPKTLNPRQAAEMAPVLDAGRLAGGVIIWDHWTNDEELVKHTVASAVRAGAGAWEHAEVTAYARENGAYRLSVRQNGAEKTYHAKKIVDASGPWIDRTRALGPGKTENWVLPVAGAHITLKKFIPCSMILQAEDGRPFFAINLGEFSRVGTTERLFGDPDRVEATEEEVDYLLRSLNNFFPSLGLSRKDILSRDAGIRPLARPKREQDAHGVPREHETRVDALGVMHVLGVKLTDHRRAAEAVVDRVVKELSQATNFKTQYPKSTASKQKI